MKLVTNMLKWVGIGIYAVCAVLIVMFLMPIGGWKALNVLTGSMKPAIQPGALVLIHRVPTSSLQPGNIITYQSPHNLHETFTHRVLKVAKVDGINTVTVKGDANPQPDAPFPSGLIVGRVAVIIPGAGKFINWLHNPFGLAALVIIPGLVVIWAEIRNLRRSLAKPSADQPAKLSTPPPDPPEPSAPPRPITPASTRTPNPAGRPRSKLDGMRRLAFLGAMVLLLAAGSASASAIHKIGTVRLQHNTLHATAGQTTGHPATIYDCLHQGWKLYGFKNQGQCVVYVIHHSQNPAPPPPFPTPHPTHTPSATPSPTPSPSRSATPTPSPKPSGN
jgi:signal peptidase